MRNAFGYRTFLRGRCDCDGRGEKAQNCRFVFHGLSFLLGETFVGRPGGACRASSTASTLREVYYRTVSAWLSLGEMQELGGFSPQYMCLDIYSLLRIS